MQFGIEKTAANRCGSGVSEEVRRKTEHTWFLFAAWQENGFDITPAVCEHREGWFEIPWRT